MRELTKSVTRFSWAMTVFGVEQAARLLTPGAGKGLDPVTEAATSQLDGLIQRGFRAGDGLQQAWVDWAFDACTLDPQRWLQVTTDAAGNSVQALLHLVSARQAPPGWGPMPPPE